MLDSYTFALRRYIQFSHIILFALATHIIVLLGYMILSYYIFSSCHLVVLSAMVV